MTLIRVSEIWDVTVSERASEREEEKMEETSPLHTHGRIGNGPVHVGGGNDR
jgi:hypothetical protein